MRAARLGPGWRRSALLPAKMQGPRPGPVLLAFELHVRFGNLEVHAFRSYAREPMPALRSLARNGR